MTVGEHDSEFGKEPYISEGVPRTRQGSGVQSIARALGNRGFSALIGRVETGILFDGTVHPDVRAAIDRARGGGAALDSGLRERFGRDLGDPLHDVRIHADAGADALARSVSARAFTTGTDVFFGSGEYRPASTEGDQLIAHELAHVVQQRGGPNSGPMVVSEPEDALEVEARSVASVLTQRGAIHGLHRTVGNAAVTRLLRQSNGGGRLPSPSAASAVPARIKGMQQQFHTAMREAAEIIDGIKFHYDYVNGIYAGAYGHAEEAAAAAHTEELKNERIREAVIGAASLALSFTPEGEAENLLGKIVESVHKIDEWRERLEKAGKVKAAFSPTEDVEPHLDADTPAEKQILGLEKVIELLTKVEIAHNHGDGVLDYAVDLSTQIAENAPDSDAIGSDEAGALNAAESACQEVLSSTDDLLAGLRELRDRRKVTIPSWAETEQDIWIGSFASSGRIGDEQTLRDHMVAIGLWGPPGQPGGRLGVAETEGTLAFYRDPKVVPGHEDEEKQQSVGTTTMDWMQVIQGEAATLPAKWQRIMLLTD